MGILPQLPPDELRAAQHIGPLVVAAELHIAAVVLEEVVEVIGLHGHIVELQEGQALFHPLLKALRPEHVVDREAGADVPDELHVVEIQEPVGIVHHLRLAGSEFNKALHLLFEAGAVVRNDLPGHHGTHVRPAGGVSDHGRPAAD